MTAPAILNLDEFETSIQKTVVLNGKRHAFAPFSVEDFINNLKEIDTYSKKDEIPVTEFFEHMIRMVTRAFPTIPEADVRALPMEKLKALSDFVKDQTEVEAEEGLAQAGEQAPKNQTGELS